MPVIGFWGLVSIRERDHWHMCPAQCVLGENDTGTCDQRESLCVWVSALNCYEQGDSYNIPMARTLLKKMDVQKRRPTQTRRAKDHRHDKQRQRDGWAGRNKR